MIVQWTNVWVVDRKWMESLKKKHKAFHKTQKRKRAQIKAFF